MRPSNWCWSCLSLCSSHRLRNAPSLLVFVTFIGVIGSLERWDDISSAFVVMERFLPYLILTFSFILPLAAAIVPWVSSPGMWFSAAKDVTLSEAECVKSLDALTA